MSMHPRDPVYYLDLVIFQVCNGLLGLDWQPGKGCAGWTLSTSALIDLCPTGRRRALQGAKVWLRVGVGSFLGDVRSTAGHHERRIAGRRD